MSTRQHAARRGRRDAPRGGPGENSSGGADESPAVSGNPAHLPAPPATALGRFLLGFVYAGRGLLYAVRTQRNVRVHAALAVAAIILGIALRISAVEFALVFVAITGVFIAEMFNTVIEACVNLITSDYHPLARTAKDVAAGAVLLSALLAVVIALFVYVPHLWPLLVRWL